MARPVIVLDHVGKRYRIGVPQWRHATFRDAVRDAVRAPWRRFRQLRGVYDPRETFWAVKDVSFKVDAGQVLGIIGRNGAGKSTLLKILSRITEPTQGEVRLRGRVASLLEVGTGFHPELTGRENVYLNGSILGLRKKEIDGRFDAIVAFSEIETFLDTPVKHYSSGMYVRLAFAVAAHLEPEVLVIDEVLAVGDAGFQRKCLGKMREVAASDGRTVLFVSHNLDAIVGLCSDVVVMEQGRCSPVLPPEEGVRRYLSGGSASGPQVDLREGPLRGGPRRDKVFAGLRIEVGNEPANVVPTHGNVTFLVDLENLDRLREPEMCIVLTNERRQRVVMFHTRYHSNLAIPRTETCRLRCRVPQLPVVPGAYGVDLVLADDRRIVEQLEQIAVVHVTFADVLGTGRLPNNQQGSLVLPCRWEVV